MSSDDKKQIKTSALDQEVIQDINRRLDIIEKIKSAKVRRSDDPKKEDVEELPLPEVDSLIGYATQGDSYHNDLELLRDRIVGEAEAPEFVSPRLQIEEEEGQARQEASEQKTSAQPDQLSPQRTPSPFDEVDDDEDEGFGDLFTDDTGGGAREEIVARAPSPEPQILGGFSLASLEALESRAAQQAPPQMPSQDTEAEGSAEEMIVQVNDDEEESWELEDLQELMDFKTQPDEGELIAEEATAVDALDGAGDSEGGS